MLPTRNGRNKEKKPQKVANKINSTGLRQRMMGRNLEAEMD